MMGPVRAMDKIQEALGLLLLCGLRLGLPILLTFLLAWALRRLDGRWRSQAEVAAGAVAVKRIAVSQIRCWELRNCPTVRRENCPAFKQREVPCWEIMRPNGHLRDFCADCKVFSRAVALAEVRHARG
jgi:hypothetical protein